MLIAIVLLPRQVSHLCQKEGTNSGRKTPGDVDGRAEKRNIYVWETLHATQNSGKHFMPPRILVNTSCHPEFWYTKGIHDFL